MDFVYEYNEMLSDMADIDDILKLERLVLNSFTSHCNDEEYDYHYVMQVLKVLNTIHIQAMDITAKHLK